MTRGGSPRPPRAWHDAGRERAALWRGGQLATARTGPPTRQSRLPGTLAGEFVDASIAAEQAHERAERRRTRGCSGSSPRWPSWCSPSAAGRVTRSSSARRPPPQRRRQLPRDRHRGRPGPRPGRGAGRAAQRGRLRHRPTPQAPASLLESSGAPAAARLMDSAGVVQWVASARTTPARGGRRGRHAAAVECGRSRSPGAVGPAGAGQRTARCTRRRSARTARSSPPRAPAGPCSCGTSAGPATRSGSAALTGPANTVYSVAFSPDGKTLAAGSADDTVRLWDVADPAQPVPLGEPLTGRPATCSPWRSARRARLAAGSADKTVRLWDVADPAAPGRWADR